MSNVEAFPLAWPDGQPRTKQRRRAPYTVSGNKARMELYAELRMMGTSNVVLSSNVPLRNDGQPYAGAMDRKYDDPGVAVYFNRKREDGTWQQQAMACDKWDTVDGNIRAIGLAIAGLRAMQRAGVSDMMDRAFAGFKALPPGPQWWTTLGVRRDAPDADVRLAWRVLMETHHPDLSGGNADKASEINAAYAAFKTERSGG